MVRANPTHPVRNSVRVRVHFAEEVIFLEAIARDVSELDVIFEQRIGFDALQVARFYHGVKPEVFFILELLLLLLLGYVAE